MQTKLKLIIILECYYDLREGERNGLTVEKGLAENEG